MAKEPKQDGSLTNTLEEKVQDRAVGTSAGDSASVMDTLRGGVETVKGAFGTVTGGVGKTWSTLVEWKDEGVCVEGCVFYFGVQLSPLFTRAPTRCIDVCDPRVWNIAEEGCANR